jgi:SnoaL-like domain
MELRIASPEMEFVVPGATLHGPDETAAFARALWEAFHDARITPSARVAAGSLAAIKGSFTGTEVWNAMHVDQPTITA